MNFAFSGRCGKQLSAGFAASIMAAALVACGSDTSTESASTTTDGARTLAVTTLGLCNEMPVYWAQKKGVFADHGLQVELIRAQGGAAGLSALQSGEVDLAFTNPFSTMRAIDQGIDLSWIATAYLTPTDTANVANSVAVKSDSKYTDAKSLEGTKIGVNEIAGINQIITSEWMLEQGADPTTVDFIALPFADLGPAVSSGQIAAAQITEQNMLPDLKSLGNPYVVAGKGEPLAFSGYVAKESAAEGDPETYAAFQAALIESSAQIVLPENQDERFAIQAAACKQDAEALKTLSEPPYAADVNLASLDRMAAMMKEQDLLDDPAEASTYVPDFVVTS